MRPGPNPSDREGAGTHGPAASGDDIIKEMFEAHGVEVVTVPSAPEYVPDPRNEPDYWTAVKLVNERRPREREDGSGGMRRLWACCGSCGLERVVNVLALTMEGYGNKPLTGLVLRCKCGGLGALKLKWANPPRIREDRKGQEGWQVAGRPRTGWFDFKTGQKHGGWD